jgi:hypothetical protein
MLVARHFPTDLPKASIREMLKTLMKEYTHRAELPPIVQEYARLSDQAGESELQEMAARLEDAMAKHQRRNPPSKLSQEYAKVTMTVDDCNDLGQDIAIAFAYLPAGSADFAVMPLLRLWAQGKAFYEVALAAIALSFPLAPGSTPASRLSATQRAVLQALTEDDPIWTCCGDTGPMLAVRGLPTTKRAMRKYLRSGNMAG